MPSRDLAHGSVRPWRSHLLGACGKARACPRSRESGCGRQTVTRIAASTRCFQSANEPLAPDDPWIGFLLPDATFLALSDLRGKPGFDNVFVHESGFAQPGQGSAGWFCAWFSGAGPADFVPGVPWTGEFKLHVLPKASQSPATLPAFLR
jgi:hypothetical protein